jgi:hypothetical protein
MRLAQALDGMNKSQLQVYYQHWYPREEMERSREHLVEKLRAAMTDPSRICRKFDVLRSAEKGFLQAILMLEDRAGSVAEIRRQRPARRIADFEVESVLKRLKEQGFLLKAGGDGRDGNRADWFTVPEEIAEALGVTLDVEKRGVGELLSLSASRVRTGNRVRDLAPAVDMDAVRERVNAIADPTLRAVLWSALEDYSGVLTLSVWRRAGSRGRLNRRAWRQELEEKELGTTGVLNLKDYGIDLEEEALCVYQEIVQAHGMSQTELDAGENDVEMAVGADLVIDLSRLLQIVFIEPLELTRDGYLYKRTEERLRSRFVLTSYENLFEGRILEHLVALAGRLQLVARREGKLRINAARVKLWEKRGVLRRIKQMFDLFLEDRGREHYSFHQRYLRRIFVELLCRSQTGRWTPARGMVKMALAQFLLSLQKLGVATAFHDRVNGNFGHEPLLVSFERLQYDLYFWLVHRLALLGIVNLGYRRGHLHSVALSSLGASVLGGEDVEAVTGGGLLVNPDFEVLQLPGGAREAEDSFILSRFAERTGSDRVKRYRLTRESVKRAILAGMGLNDLLSFLEDRAREVIPGNVTYTVREWAEGLELIRRHRAVVLRSRTGEGMDRLLDVLKEKKIPFERVAPTIVLLRGTKGERALLLVREKLRDEGIYID